MSEIFKKSIFLKIVFFVLCLLFFLIPGFLFKNEYDFYNQLIKPSFAFKDVVFSFVWTVLYIIQALFITTIYYKYIKEDKHKNILGLIIVNSIINVSYVFIFFGLKNLFLGFVVCLLTLTTLCMLIMKLIEENIKEWYYEIPYLIWMIIATILSISIYILN